MSEANVWTPSILVELSADTKQVEERQIATLDQVLFTLGSFVYTPNTGSLLVFKNGQLLTKNVDWAENSTTTFSLVVPALAGDVIAAVGLAGITGVVDIRDTDIFIPSVQNLRDYAGTEVTVYVQGTTTLGDGGEGFYQKFTGAGAGFYVDNGARVIVPTGGDGSTGWVKRRPKEFQDNYTALIDAHAATPYVNGDSVTLTDAGVADDFTIVVSAGHGLTSTRGKRCVLDVNTYAQRMDSDVDHFEWWEISTSATAAFNGTAYLEAIEASNNLKMIGGPYSFDFANTGATVTHTEIKIDLGETLHTFTDFANMIAANLTHMQFSGRIDCNNTSLLGLAKADKLQVLEIGTIEVVNVLNVAKELWLFDWRHATELPFQLNCENAKFKSWRNQSPTLAMTGFGNANSASTLATMHQLSFENLDVEDFYSVDVDGTTIIAGESDFFRMFNNPSTINIKNLRAVNFAKRFLKSQEECILNVDYVFSTLDSRFTASSNHIGTFEAQYVNQTKPSRFFIKSGDVDYSAATGIPIFYNASGFDHEVELKNLNYTNIGVFSASQNIKLDMDNTNGSGLRINLASSDRITLHNFIDSDLNVISCIECIIDCFEIASPTYASTSFLMTSADLRHGQFTGWDIGNKIATFRNIEDVDIIYTTGTVDGRPFKPIPNINATVLGMGVTNPTGNTVIMFADTTNTGNVLFRDFKSTGITQLGFFSGGTWDFVRDNCDNNVITGGGVNSNFNTARSDGGTGGTASAGAGNQYIELEINGITYKLLHDGTV